MAQAIKVVDVYSAVRWAIRCGRAAASAGTSEEESFVPCYRERHEDKLTRFRVQYRFVMHGKSGVPGLTLRSQLAIILRWVPHSRMADR